MATVLLTSRLLETSPFFRASRRRLAVGFSVLSPPSFLAAMRNACYVGNLRKLMPRNAAREAREEAASPSAYALHAGQRRTVGLARRYHGNVEDLEAVLAFGLGMVKGHVGFAIHAIEIRVVVLHRDADRHT